MKKIFAFAAVLLLGTAAFAQETNKDENGNLKFGSYETNRFRDNWFVNANVGENFTWDVANFDPKDLEYAFPSLQVNVGKWFTPEYGARIGWRGLKNTVNGNKENFNYFNVDGLINLRNLFRGYRETRVWEFSFFGGAGVLADKKAGAEWSVDAGLLNTWKVSDVLGLNFEVGGNLAPGTRYGNYGQFVTFPYATIGLNVNLGRTNWTRTSTTAAAAAAAIAAADAARKAAEAKVAGAEKAAADANAAAKNAKDEANQLKDEAAKAAADAANLGGLFDEPVVVYFEIGKSTLTAAEKAHAEYAIKNIVARGENVKFTLGGSADTKTGTAKRNKQLSEQRAKTVYNLIDELGVSRDNITVVEWDGKTQRFGTNELNRAVIIEKQ